MSPNDQLKINKSRRIIIECVFVAGLLATLAIAGATVFFYDYQTLLPEPLPAKAAKAIESIVIALLVGALYVNGSKTAFKALTNRLAPEWVIEVCEDVVKVHGPVGFLEWDEVQLKMLAAKPGYMPVEGAGKKFGCTMAAVPASKEYISSREELARLGFVHGRG